VVTTRVTWDSLPDDIRRDIEAHTGRLHRVEPVSSGFNSELAAVLHTADESTFVKGLRADHPRVWTQKQEKAVNPYVQPVTATLRWSIDNDEWNLLAFEHAPGRHVDYSPGSPDLAKFVQSLQRLQELPCPDIELKLAERRWASYTDSPALFAGDHLLHTEWSPSNVLVGDAALFVDWAWATRGAAWIDPACWVIWLIASGHPPLDAETWAAQIPSWNDAPADAVAAFAAAQAALWSTIAEADPEPWIEGMSAAAQRWSESRRIGAGSQRT
jgi:hypothetical protein